MRRASAARLACLAVLLSTQAWASWQDLPDSDFTMAAPPSPLSPESARDYDELLKLQAARKPDECSAAASQASPDFQSLFGGSGILSKPEVDASSVFIDSASKLVARISGYFKKKFARARPYDVDGRVRPCIPKPGGGTSYPSTHAAAGVLDACLLGRLFPQRAKTLAAYGLRVGELRLIAGVHHPSDVAAGQELGAQVCERLLKEPDFRAELARVQASLP
jgi:acid phosphatase (class A)